jgi:L-lactate dehydrogenase complex protein LldG
MADARENIMQRIRQANRFCSEAISQDVLKQRLQQHERGPQPGWSDDLVNHFIQKSQQSAATIAQIKSEHDIVDAVLTYMDEQSLDNNLLCASTELIDGLNWPSEVTADRRTATTADKIVLTEAFAGIAETGSVVMCSSRQTPVSLNFLPDHFLCVVRRNSVVNTIEDLWERIRQQGAGMPRAVNIITGPSRTADVEQIIQMGAHGPRKVHLFLMG